MLNCVAKQRREKNQQDATNPMFIIKLLSQHVSGIIMPIIGRTRPCATAYGVCTGCAGCGCVQLGRKLCALSEGYCSALVVLAVVVCSWVVSCVHCVKVTVRA